MIPAMLLLFSRIWARPGWMLRRKVAEGFAVLGKQTEEYMVNTRQTIADPGNTGTCDPICFK
jgi:hypothetical protein